MSVGNLKDQGNQGKNFPYQLAVLQLLDQINTAIPAAACCPTAATEVTLQSVYNALLNGQTFDQALVVDTGGVGCPTNCPTYVQIRIFDIITHTFGPPVYYDASGAVVVPVGPLQFVNPQYVLDNILLQVTAFNSIFTPVVRTPTYIQAVAAGSVAAGARSVSVYNSGTTAGVWLGTAIAPGVQLAYDAGGQGDTLGAFPYTASATATLEITTIV